jgi:ribose-phosphate pyrophosphokinase
MEKVVLLADSKSNAWNFAEKIQSYIKEHHKLDIPIQQVEMEHFNNDETKMRVPETVRRKEVYFVQDSTKNPNEWWTDILLIKDLLLNSDIENLTFVLPNLMYPRQDRKTESGVPISARAVARSISPGLRRIITMDLHSPNIEGFYPENVPLTNLYSFPEVIKHLKETISESDLEKLVLVSPDAGGVDRVKAFAKRLNSIYPIAFTYKFRTKPGEVDEMWLVGDVKDRDVLVVDDIYDTCGTQISCVGVLEKNGARRKFAYATHGLFTKREGFEELKKTFDRVMTSNTHYREGGDIEIIDVSPVFAEAIYRVQKGQSISKLFE